jgi:hypothetical protein
MELICNYADNNAQHYFVKYRTVGCGNAIIYFGVH